MVAARALESMLKGNRLVVVILLSVMALAWLFLTDMADMENISAVMAIAMQGPPWGATGFALMFLMWAVLMVGMTLTSAAPMILLFATINRKRVTGSAQHAPTRCFRACLSSRLDRI
jgi:hypothetical protein